MQTRGSLHVLCSQLVLVLSARPILLMLSSRMRTSGYDSEVVLGRFVRLHVQDMAVNAQTPSGYTQVMRNVTAAINSNVVNYLSFNTLTSYDTLACQVLCDQTAGCLGFNIYVERDPSVNPDSVQCPNPASTTNYKVSLVTLEQMSVILTYHSALSTISQSTSKKPPIAANGAPTSTSSSQPPTPTTRVSAT